MCMHMPMPRRTPTCTCTRPRAHAHAHVHVHMPTCTCTCPRAHAHAHVHMRMPVCLRVAYVLTSLGLGWPHLLLQSLRLGGVARALLLPLDRLPAQPATQLMHLLPHRLPVAMQRLGGPALLRRV